MTSMEGLATGPGMAEGMTEPGVGSAKSESYEEAKPESTETTILNLEEFMDVEYTYRCKFCPFTCNSMNGVTAHILSCHMPNKDSTRVEGSERVVRVSGGHGDVCGGAQVLAAPVEEPGGRVAGPAVAADIVAESITMAVGQLSGTVVGEEEEEAGTVGQSQSAGTGQQTSAYVGSQDLGKTSADADAATGSDVTVVETGSPGSEYREVFLCGQCSLGFTSMEECKEHMFKDHNISIASMEKSEHEDVAVETQADEVAESPFKVSVGTQAETFKKPGRKRKPKVAVDEVPGGADSDTGLGLLKAVKKEVSLLSSQYQKERESQGKRRVRLPKVLQEEYLVSKRRPNRGHTREKWTLQCDVPGCQGKFKTDGSLQYHLTCHVIPANEPSGDDGATARKSPEIPASASASNLVCPQCSMQFDTWRPLRLHLWTKHRVDMDLLKCYQCDFRTDRARKLEVHEEIHSDDKPYECGVCDKAFKQLAQLKNHEVTHQGQRLPRTDQRWYHSKQCHICNRLLADSKSLKKHIEIVHEKLKPYKCEFCGHVTSRKHMLLVHLRTHTGEKPHKCDMCSFETSDHNTLRRHRMRHTGQKPYKCQYCAYSCIQAVSLKIHMKNKHPGSAGLFYCDQCHYHTVNARSWHQHQEDHSTGLIESQQLLQQQREDEGRAEHETLTLKRAAEASGVWPEQGAENAAVSLMSLTGGTASTDASTAPVQLQFEVVQQQESMRGDAGATADAPASAAAGGIQSLVLADTAGDGVQYVYCSAENASPLGGAQQDAKATTLDAIRLADIGVLQQQNKQDALYAVAYQAVGADAQTNSPANSVLSNLGQVEVIPGGAGFMYTPQTQQSHAVSDAVATTTAMETVQIQGGTVVHGEPMAMTRSARGASNSRIKFSSAGNLVVTSGKSGEMTVANDSQATTHILNFPSGTSMEQILEALQQGRLKTSNS